MYVQRYSMHYCSQYKKLEIYKYTVLKEQLVGYIHTIKLLCSHYNEILIDKEIHGTVKLQQEGRGGWKGRRGGG